MRDSNNLAWLVTQIIWNFMTICIAWGGIHRCIERVDAVYIPPFPLLIFSLMFIFFLLWHVLFMGFLTYLSDIWAGLLKLALIDSRFLIFYLIHLYPRWVVWKGVVLAGWNDLQLSLSVHLVLMHTNFMIGRLFLGLMDLQIQCQSVAFHEWWVFWVSFCLCVWKHVNSLYS